MNKKLASIFKLRLLGVMLLMAILLPGSVMAIPASPGDGDNDGIITGPRLVGNTTFRGCFASGPDTSGNADPDWNKDVDTITGALKGTGSWNDANMTKLKNGKRADIETCVNAAKGVAVPGDEFIFYFSGHGGNNTFQDGVQDQHETTADLTDESFDSFDNHLLLGDTTAGTRSMMTDDELAKLLSGFKQSVTIVVILDSCNSHTFTDGSADLGSVTQKKPDDNDVLATSHLALIAASTTTNPTCSAGMTDRIADGLKSQGSHPKADKNKDGVVTAKEAADHAKAYLPELKPKCYEAEPFTCPMPEEPGATYRGPLPPEVDSCPTVPNPGQEDTDDDYYGDVCDDDDDNDGLTDQQEAAYGTNPLKVDTDSDWMPDGYEVRFPCLKATVFDAWGNPDNDSAVNLTEYGQGTDPCTLGSGDDYGDAPEGGLAYPIPGIVGAFPTCRTVTTTGSVQHGPVWAHFVWTGTPQLAWDTEPDGNAGLCPNCFPAYDADECYRDGDAGLMFPQPYTIDNFMNVTTCPKSLGTALGTMGQPATWGGSADIWIVNTMPTGYFYVNVLMDWNQDGKWGGITEHVLVDWPVPPSYNGPLSGLGPPGFMIGPNAGYVWTRFSITERTVGAGWTGEGVFEDGESEDYLLRIETIPLDFGDAPDPTYPTLTASNGARHFIQAGFMLGNLIDSEADGQPEPQALGDDNDPNGDDEDGVTFTTGLIQGQQACVDVFLTDASGLGGSLDAWVDFDGDGAWAHPGEQVFASRLLIAGNNPGLCFTVPFNAVAGSTFARFRLSQQGGLKPAGAAGFGEVEDYQVTIDPVLTVTKTLTAPLGRSAAISDTVTFEIVIHNSGLAAVTTLPLWDYYSPACLENPTTDPAADGAGTDSTLGILHWADLGSLAAGKSITVTIDFHANRTPAMYWKEGGWLDYAPKGMPDFDQKQDQWDNPPGSGAAWYYCGPVAAANSLWWFDSKFEPFLVSPPAISDGYPIVQGPAAGLYDDHSPANVQSFVSTLVPLMGTVPGNGTNVKNLAAGIVQHLANVGRGAQYTVTSPPIAKPNFQWVANEVRRSEDVILLLGFYQDIIPGEGVYWERTGGHYVTVAGVDLRKKLIAFSDPYNDRAELGAPWYGRVLPVPHAALHPGIPTGEVHNDAKYASHDVYQVQDTTSPGGTWGPAGYVDPSPPVGCQQISNFDGQNTPDNFVNQPCRQDADALVAEVEFAVAVSPRAATVTCDPTTNIAVVSGAVDAAGNMLPEAQAHARVSITQSDWGDAPDPTYPTLNASNGAVHTLSSGLWLGATVDPEANGQPDLQAMGDDNDANGDDEDGVTFLSPLTPGKLARITVTASAAGVLDAWMDFNGNGTWEHLAEHVFGGSVTVSAGANNLSFTVPPGAAAGPTFARFRLSSAGGLLPTGLAPDGEVEDYAVTIQPSGDFKTVQPPDPNLSGYHTHDSRTGSVVSRQTGADDWVCKGGLVTDLEWWGNYELDYLGSEDRRTGVDRFHISIHASDPVIPSQPGTALWEFDVPFTAVNETAIGATNLEGSPIYLYRFEFDHPFVQLPGSTYWFDIGARSLDPGQPAIWRWQESSRGGPPWQGQYSAVYRTDTDLTPGTWAAVGSDMAFAVTSKPADLGDAPESIAGWQYPTLLGSGGATHALVPGGPFMGATVDADADGQPTALADGDDLDLDGDDEDGVTFLSALVPSRVATVTVDMAASPVGCLLNGWLDLNRDGDWADNGEKIFTDRALAAGSLHTLTFTVSPAYTPMVGTTFARFRCSRQAGLSYGGPADDGEVEDYRVQIMAPPLPPVVSITVINTIDVRLSWPPVTQDIYGNSITADGYRIFRATAPYATLPHVASLWGPLPNPVTWDDAGKVGDPATNYYYTVDAVLRDIYVNEVYSVRSNEVGEFGFALTPGAE